MTVSELIRTKRAVRQFTFGNYSLRDDMMSLGKNTFLLIFEGRVIVCTGGSSHQGRSTTTSGSFSRS